MESILGVLVATLSVLVVLLIGWQIHHAVDFINKKKEIKEDFKKEKEIFFKEFKQKYGDKIEDIEAAIVNIYNNLPTKYTQERDSFGKKEVGSVEEINEKK